MTDAISKMIEEYPEQGYVRATSKKDALELLRALADEIRAMEDFTRFPEGAEGVVIYAMLRKVSEVCPDGDDLGQFRQGYEAILKHSYRSIAPTLL